MIKIPPSDKTKLVPLTGKIRPERKELFELYCKHLGESVDYVLDQILAQALRGFKTEGEPKQSKKREAVA